MRITTERKDRLSRETLAPSRTRVYNSLIVLARWSPMISSRVSNSRRLPGIFLPSSNHIKLCHQLGDRCCRWKISRRRLCVCLYSRLNKLRKFMQLIAMKEGSSVNMTPYNSRCLSRWLTRIVMTEWYRWVIRILDAWHHLSWAWLQEGLVLSKSWQTSMSVETLSVIKACSLLHQISCTRLLP